MIQCSLKVVGDHQAVASSPAIACTSAVPLLTTAYGGMVSLWHLENTECLRSTVGAMKEGLKCSRVFEAEQRRPGGQQMELTSPQNQSQSRSGPLAMALDRNESSPLQLFHSSPIQRLRWLRSAEKSSGVLACLTLRGVHLYSVAVPSYSNASILGTATPGQMGKGSCYAAKALFSSDVLHTGFVNDCLFGSGRFITASDDHTAKTWDLMTTKEESVVRCTSPAVALAKDSRNSAVFAIGEAAGAVSCYDSRVKRIALRFRVLPIANGERLQDVDWSPSGDSSTVAVAAGGSWTLWDVRLPKAAFVDHAAAHPTSVKQVKWSTTHSKLFATSSEQEVKIWDCSNPHTPIATLVGQSERSIGSVTWLSDSATCCFTDGQMLRFCPVRM